jgi:hypothetical protein
LEKKEENEVFITVLDYFAVLLSGRIAALFDTAADSGEHLRIAAAVCCALYGNRQAAADKGDG